MNHSTAKYLIGTGLILAMLAGMAVLSSFSRGRKIGQTCTGIEISFADSLHFLSEDDVRKLIDREYGDCEGRLTDSIQLYRIEDLLEARSTVKECESWLGRDGTLHVRISQRHPEVMFRNGDVKFYADGEGYIFPLSGKTAAGIPEISGSLPLSVGAAFRGEPAEERERVWIKGIIEMLDYFNNSRSWKGKVREYRVNADHDIVIAIEGREELFILGHPDRMDEKTARIEKYFNWILPEKGDGYYRSVNVKYNKQIVCRKDI